MTNTIRFATTLALACLAIVLPCSAQESIALKCAALTESSGIAVSTLDPNIVWTHNDSGDKPRLFAFTRTGDWVAEVTLVGIRANDWEDMCSFQRDGKHYLAIGDVGDNSAGRSSVDILLIEEPILGNTPSELKKLEVSALSRINVRYEGGAVDCEALAYDSIHNQFILLSKEKLRCCLYTFPCELSARGIRNAQARKQHTFFLPMITGGDISPDGQQLVLTTYGPACIVHRNQDTTWNTTQLLTVQLPARRQGESICFADDGKTFLVTSEFAPTPMWSLEIAKLRKE
ncbi:MAG: hypothetical protein R3C53_13575 [Pirellulaceae bacterium]